MSHPIPPPVNYLILLHCSSPSTDPGPSGWLKGSKWKILARTKQYMTRGSRKG